MPASTSRNFPERPVTVVTSGAGGGADAVVRLIAPALATELGQPVTVENLTAGIAPVSTVAKAVADGHTLLAYSSSLWISPLMRAMPYDAVRDFVPVAWLSKAPNVIVVHPSVPATSLGELLVLPKEKPSKLSYGSSGARGTGHLTGELFKTAAAVDIVHVPCNGNAAALEALFAGRVQIMFSNAGSIAPHIKAGRVRALAVTSAEPSMLLPEIPSAAACGLPDYESTSIIGLFAPHNTPSEIVTRLNRDVGHVLSQPEVRVRFFDAGLEPVGGAPQALAALLTDEIDKLGSLIRKTGIRAA